MEKQIIKCDKNVLAESFIFLDVPLKGPNEKFINRIVENASPSSDVTYTGYQNKKSLQNGLNFFIFGKNSKSKEFKYEKETISNIKEILDKTLKICQEFIDSKLYIFVFPTLDEFVIKRMNGVNGFSPHKNVILLFLNTIKGWETAFKETICHEITHAISPYYNGCDCTLGEAIILDGIAEHFRKCVIGGEKTPWTKSLTREEAGIIFKKLVPQLGINNLNLHQEVFFGTGKYPLWAGYSIGYYLLEDYLKKQKEIDWKKIINMPPKSILKEFL